MESSERYEDSPVYKTASLMNYRRLSDMIPARVVLYMLSFSGFVVSFMMRMDINIAMVSMVKYHDSGTNVSVTSTCYTPTNTTIDAADAESKK